uniref:Transposase n=1 Tax=Haemonchus contortus TaxID=6289 RepID=A0A7I4YND9_HAECO
MASVLRGYSRELARNKMEVLNSVLLAEGPLYVDFSNDPAVPPQN